MDGTALPVVGRCRDGGRPLTTLNGALGAGCGCIVRPPGWGPARANGRGSFSAAPWWRGGDMCKGPGAGGGLFRGFDSTALHVNYVACTVLAHSSSYMSKFAVEATS